MTTHHPHSRLARLPWWISHFLGYRSSPPKKQPEHIVWFWSFIGAFIGLSIIQGIFNHSHYFLERHVPSIVASFGASAVLCYGAIEAPLAQPRALIFGHFFSALTGLCITKLFSLSSHFDSLRWLAGSLSSAAAIVIMQITATTHPPAGATALLVATNDAVWALSWYYLPVVLLSSSLVLVSALLVNNIQRRYPVFWFKPAVPTQTKPSPDLQETPSTSSIQDTAGDSTPVNEDGLVAPAEASRVSEKGVAANV